MANKFNDTEIIAAINTVKDILDLEEFDIDVVEVGDGDWGTSLEFKLIDKQGGNLGNIESEQFDNLASIIDRLDIYHNDYLYKSFEERKNAGEVIERNDWDRKILMFIESNYCGDLLEHISASVYSDYVATGFGLNEDRLDENKEKGIDDLDYLLFKDIAQKIIGTQSAYVMVEYNNKIYLSYYGYGDGEYYEENEEGVPIRKISPEENLLRDVESSIQMYDEQGNNETFTRYDNYKEIVDKEISQVYEDMDDIGLLDEDGQWQFYLSKYEMIFMGINELRIENQLEYENEFIPKRIQAENLPKGWIWKMYGDGSGNLESPDGKTYFDYDLTTGEYKVTPDKSYDFFMVENYETGGYSIGGFDKFKEYAEDYINKNILNKKEKGENNMKYYSVSYEKNDISQAIIVKANNYMEAQDYIQQYRNADKVYGATKLEQSTYEEYKRRGYPEVEVPDDFNKGDMNVKELSRDELTELKQNYYSMVNDIDLSYGELVNIDELVSDEEIFNYFSDVTFTKNDFFCNQNDENNKVKNDNDEIEMPEL